MTGLSKDLRSAYRILVKSPGLSTVVVLTLGLGIGGNVAVFSVSNSYLRSPISFPEVDRLVMGSRLPGRYKGGVKSRRRISRIGEPKNTRPVSIPWLGCDTTRGE
jgi:hypothetical protein